MRRSTWLIGLGATMAVAAGQAAFAQTSAAATTGNSQQQKMGTCNAQAKTQNLSGDDRKSFMKTCLSSAAPAKKGNSQQEKMKSCNADAKTKNLTGTDRQSFMKTCLSGSSSG
jgi:psiF repeat